jgi:tRNA threonylcarbamoyladenosine biosynthesis protein TsaB
VILALDTSNEQASVALAGGGRLQAETSWLAGRNHSRQLTAVIRDLLRLAALAPGQLTAVCVAIGPGSFSGVRVGISEGKGLALGLGIPLIGVSTLDVIGLQASFQAGKVAVAMQAGRGLVYLAAYEGRGEHWRRTSEYRLASMDEAALRAGEANLLAGDAAEVVARKLLETGRMVDVEPPPWRMRRAGFLAELGKRYLDADGRDQLHELEPLYLRRSAAEEKRCAGSVE